jgi:WD40 repeat protein
MIVSGSHDRTVRIWAADTGQPIGYPLTGHTGWVTAVALGRVGDRAMIVSGSHDRTVRIWAADTGQPIGHPLTGHTGWVSAVALGRIDKLDVIVSGSNDETVRIWNPNDASSIACVDVFGAVLAVDSTSGGLVCAATNQAVCVFEARNLSTR